MLVHQGATQLTRPICGDATRRPLRVSACAEGIGRTPPAAVRRTSGATTPTTQGSCGPTAHVALSLSRRGFLAGLATILVPASSVGGAAAEGTGIEILEDVTGIGSRGARRGDLLLVHYVGRLEGTGQVFDSTRGGLAYRDGGPGVLRPAAVALGGGPVPGVCEGLQQALMGMSIGGRRTVRVPPSLGFGGQTVLAPYAVVPGGSVLVYEVELLRLSAVGPDQLTKGISKCGAGGANQQAENCGTVSYAEFL